MKQRIKSALNGAFLAPLRKMIFEGQAAIFMLHRVAPKDENGIFANENMKVSPEFLEDFIITLRDLGYKFISLDKLHSALIKGDLARKCAVFTLDDGYADNFEFAYPIFSAHGVPFCIYVCASFLEKCADAWWYGLEDFLNSRESFEFNGAKFRLDSREARNSAFLAIRSHLIGEISDYCDAQKTLESHGIAYNPRDYDNLMLTCDALKTMIRGGVLTLGAHTYAHPIFNNLSSEAIVKDINRANEIFMREFGFMPSHFAYPYGGRIEVSNAHFRLLENLNCYKTATTTRHGMIFNAHKNHLFALPRVFLSEDFKLESLYNFRKKRVVVD